MELKFVYSISSISNASRSRYLLGFCADFERIWWPPWLTECVVHFPCTNLRKCRSDDFRANSVYGLCTEILFSIKTRARKCWGLKYSSKMRRSRAKPVFLLFLVYARLFATRSKLLYYYCFVLRMRRKADLLCSVCLCTPSKADCSLRWTPLQGRPKSEL